MAPPRSSSSQTGCPHSVLTSSPSPYALSSGHQPYTEHRLLTAITGERKHVADAASQYHLAKFPAPLVLPGDAIDLDPKYPSQSFRSWVNEGERNPITAEGHVIYVAAPPEIDRSVEFMDDWRRPNIESSMAEQQAAFVTDVDVRSLISYLQAFYYGLEVKPLPVPLTFTTWDESIKSKSVSKSRKTRDIQAVALSNGTEATRVRVRRTPPPNANSEGAFPYSHQLNLNDMTDMALSMLPSDAYALLFVSSHDMYESEDDDFCCGRAWGASRVAIVSSARYQPCLDDVHGVDREHIWPASHCTDFVDRLSGLDHSQRNRRNGAKKRTVADRQASGAQSAATDQPLTRAVSAASLSAVDINGVFLFRLCRTASHELGHCFGLDHCMYMACMMQGTASMAEDMRQPPYLCPVCEAKVAWAVVAEPQTGGRAKRAADQTREKNWDARTEDDKREMQLVKWKKERWGAIETFCEQVSGAFAPLLAWSTAILAA
ncbi:hypothetical protein A1O7_05703 [Cladophialophora yegresii CBS 114405]|uniref:Archaemetzincin-2 n=1 Tax=Cladophialophora yegresii CBS 114405 TaxID=1182544 RepID=W9VRT4_9EURO|nr:uncharacterized protein A1O7_05703 [Cladophialophora yegresii CBS 114405]EXJ58278.1 hypothetical protein A1O7_05703 [Cladophialophora yegresii CBS 114405]